MEVAARRLGLNRLYPEQQRIVAEASAGRDVLVVLPTGYGKSACYQIPSMMLPKPVVLMLAAAGAARGSAREAAEASTSRCVRLDGTVRGKARREAPSSDLNARRLAAW